jgi:hypothetical protein
MAIDEFNDLHRQRMLARCRARGHKTALTEFWHDPGVPGIRILVVVCMRCMVEGSTEPDEDALADEA